MTAPGRASRNQVLHLAMWASGLAVLATPPSWGLQALWLVVAFPAWLRATATPHRETAGA